MCDAARYRCCCASVNVGDVPPDSQKYRSVVRRSFRTGVSFTCPQAREFAALVVQDCILPLPCHLLFLSFHHVVVLQYASVGRPSGVWQARCKTHVYVIHLIMEYAASR